MRKKTLWKKGMGLLLSAALLGGLAGCGQSGGDAMPSGGTAADTGSEAAAAENGMNTAETAEKVTVTFSEHVADIEAQEPHMMKIIRAFEEKYPNIKIDISGKEVSEHNTQMTLLAGEDKLPDIFWLEQATAREFAENGYLYDLTDSLEEYGINDSLLPGLVHSCTVDGRDYGIPSEVMMVGFFYNKELFDQAGIQNAPVTYEEFRTAVEKLNEKGIVPLTVGAQDNYSIWAFETMLARYGFFEKLDGLNDGSQSWVNEDFLRFFEKVEEMRENRTFTPDIANIGYFEAKETFLGGNAAMFNTGAWDIGDFEASDMAGNIGFFWGPTFSDSPYPQEIGIKASGGVYVVSQKAEQDPAVLDAVLKFWQFYYGEEGTGIIAEETSALPCSRYDGKINEAEHPVLAAMITALNDDWTAVTEPFNSLSTNVAYGFFDAACGVMTGVYTPQEAAQYIEDLHSSER